MFPNRVVPAHALLWARKKTSHQVTGAPSLTVSAHTLEMALGGNSSRVPKSHATNSDPWHTPRGARYGFGLLIPRRALSSFRADNPDSVADHQRVAA